jgi:drug/metabolite transporter (DMT)-like permease
VTFGLPFAILSAALFGTADFLGGLSTRRAPALLVTLIVSVLGAAPVLALAPWLPGTPGVGDLLWGAAAGVCGASGVTLLYHVLARGPVGVVAPIAGVCGVAVPVLTGFALGERPTPAAIAGIALAALAVALVSASAGGGAARRAERGVIVLAIVAGLGLGAFLVCLARVRESAGLMPLLSARGAGAIVAIAALLARRESFVVPPGARATAIACALVDGLANVLYLIVVRTHAVSIVGTIVSLAPALTIVLGRFVLHEHFHRKQLAGLALAAVAVVLLTAG